MSPRAHSGYTLNAWVNAEKESGQKNSNDATAQPAWAGGGDSRGGVDSGEGVSVTVTS